jgi:hypothetical protein
MNAATKKTKKKVIKMTYSSSLALSRSQFAGSGRNSVSFQARTRAFGPISNTIILIVLACLLGLLYLTQVTKTNAFGYTINELQTQQTALESKNADLQVDSARLQSLDRTQNSAVAQSMVAVAPSGSAQ